MRIVVSWIEKGQLPKDLRRTREAADLADYLCLRELKVSLRGQLIRDRIHGAAQERAGVATTQGFDPCAELQGFLQCAKDFIVLSDLGPRDVLALQDVARLLPVRLLRKPTHPRVVVVAKPHAHIDFDSVVPRGKGHQQQLRRSKNKKTRH